MHRFLSRIPIPLWQKLVSAAALNKRSVNSEIIIRLQASFPEWRQL